MGNRGGRATAFLTVVALAAIVCDCQAKPPYRRYTVLQPPLATVVSGPFLFTTDIPEEVIPELSAELLELERTISTELRLPRLSVPVRVYLFQDRDRYLSFIREHAPILARPAERRRALFLLLDGLPRIFLYRTAELSKDLRHELTHALLNTTMQNLPIWLDEGLAVFYETPGRHATYRALLRGQLHHGAAPSLYEMDRLTTDLQMGMVEYATAWSWVDFFLHGPTQAQTAFHEYLADMQKDAQGPRLPQRLEAGIKDPDGAWRVYVERLLMSER